MSVASGLLLFAVIWVVVLFVVLPLRLTSQSERGDVAPGTPSSAPEKPPVRRKLVLATVLALVVWALVAGVILSGAITLDDLDWLSPQAPAGDRGG